LRIRTLQIIPDPTGSGSDTLNILTSLNSSCVLLERGLEGVEVGPELSGEDGAEVNGEHSLVMLLQGQEQLGLSILCPLM